MHKFVPSKVKIILTIILNVVFVSLQPTSALAWGGRGHDSICEAAVYLVQNKNLKEFLINKPHMMGHLCNIPDIYWKSLPMELRRHGDSGHYIDPEIIGLSAKDIPTDYKSIIEKYTGQDNKEKSNSKILSIPLEFGSNWWRADQFYRRALTLGQELKNLKAPANSKEEQDENLAYNKTFYDMIISLGVMGHFVGDNSQPFHTTSDYDGYAANHGGIHAYYEDSCVAYFGADLHNRIYKKALKFKNASFLKSSSVLDRMKALAEISNKEIKDVFKADPVTTPSTIKLEHGMSLKVPAQRKPAEVGYKKFEKLQIEQMARSAIMLATFWDEVFEKSGNPEAKAYKSYKYPLTVDFIMPDYYDTKAEDDRKKK
jgi:hypothetical protein